METIWQVYFIGAAVMFVSKLAAIILLHVTAVGREKLQYVKKYESNEYPTALGVVIDTILWPVSILVWLSRIKL